MLSTAEYFGLILHPGPWESSLRTRIPHASTTMGSGINTVAVASARKLNETMTNMSISRPVSREPKPPLSPPPSGPSDSTALYALAEAASMAASLPLNSTTARVPSVRTTSNDRKALPTSGPSHSPKQIGWDHGQTSPPVSERSVPENGAPSRKKTDYEKGRGQKLQSDDKGQMAKTPCKHCINRPHRCRVAIDPVSFDSFKCAYCISNKVSCSFNFHNPGLNYLPETMNRISDKEKAKKASRVKAKQTNDKRKAKAKEARAKATETVPAEMTTGSEPNKEEETSTDDTGKQESRSHDLEPINIERHRSL
ncbi:hypothetical protein F5Y06DRAFT_295078 [Hypoxylon sp. FL0890]|nr:hypothetical protein F5Y06DRAFT_295078 [Hypoxylon sp. FL0890]